MNDKLQIAITDLLNKAIDGTNFITGEIPDYVHELLLWYGCRSFIFFALGIVMAALSLRFVKPFIIKHYNWVEGDGTYNLRDISYFPVGIFTLLWFGVMLDFIFNWEWLQIWIAPRVFLVEYAAGLVN